MKSKLLVVFLIAGLVTGLGITGQRPAQAGEKPFLSEYRVLAPIRHGNLTVFPVVAATSHDTQEFLTLDEGLRSREVVVSEYGKTRAMIRRRPARSYPDDVPEEGAQVNRLVLVNNAKRPLILLAGEIVSGGKQDRVIGKDMIVPPESDPIDLDVFCVEPGRWVADSSNFGAMGGNMAAPSIRGSAMGDKDQGKVWAKVGEARENMAASAPPKAAAELHSTTSYNTSVNNPEVRKHMDALAAPIEQDYRSVIRDLRDRNAVGVVVAVNGQFVWVDIFASTDLLQKYWPKLVRSYAAEAIVAASAGGDVNEKSAQAFLENMEGTRETVENEAGLYRYTEVSGEGFKAFELKSLLPKTGFDLHIAKMAG